MTLAISVTIAMEKGHWTADCAVLKAKNKGRKVSVKPAAFAAPVKDCCVSEVFTPHTCEPVFVLFGKLLLLSFEKGLCLSWEVM